MVELDKARPIVKRALDLGVNFFDTAISIPMDDPRRSWESS